MDSSANNYVYNIQKLMIDFIEKPTKIKVSMVDNVLPKRKIF